MAIIGRWRNAFPEIEAWRSIGAGRASLQRREGANAVAVIACEVHIDALTPTGRHTIAGSNGVAISCCADTFAVGIRVKEEAPFRVGIGCGETTGGKEKEEGFHGPHDERSAMS